MHVIPVIIAGGSGTRLWPLSRKQYPKQFLSLAPGKPTLLQQTVLRLQGLDYEAPLTICNEEHRFLAAEQLRTTGHDDLHILLEPVGRNTAPAIALAALQATCERDDAILVVLPADHAIEDTGAFQQSIRAAVTLAKDGKLVTCGIVPTRPETGYGYIKQGKQLKHGYCVEKFVEKPELEIAETYIKQGGFLWNSGIFVFQATQYLEELRCYAPDIFNACKSAMLNTEKDLSFTRVNRDAFETCPSQSIDYAVMEKTRNAAVVPMAAGWSDVGSWSALWEISPKDPAGNATSGDVYLQACKDNYVHSTDRLVVGIDVENLIIVETNDALLVASKAQSQMIKEVAEALKKSGRPESTNHRKVYRPWGNYDVIDQGHRYQAKRITVKPGAKLSTQIHHHRAEHWIVVSGTAKITNGEKTYILTENQSTYIPVGQIHSLENPGRIELELIEVQSGSYLGEDDIVRINDIYGRS